MTADDPITLCIGQLQAGDPAAARMLWDRYFHRLVGLARKRLRNAPRRMADEEDIALSAFDSFCRNAEQGRFPDLNDQDSLWRLLATFTLRKAAHHIRDANRQKRGGGKSSGGASGLEAVLSKEPSPELAAELSEECERRLTALGNDMLRRVALLRMDGYSVRQIAELIGRAPRSVKRKLLDIRDIWAREMTDEPG